MSESPRKLEQILRRIEWTVIRRLDGMLHGNYRTLFRGVGMDLAGLREYQFSDDVRHIDWNVTARLQAPHVRQFNEDREVTAWFLLDLSPSVDFGSVQMKKRSVLIDSVATLTRLLTRHGNKVGVLCYGGDVDTMIPAQGGRRHVLHIINNLINRPELPSAQATDLGEFLKTAAQVVRRRSLVFLMSDFISAPGWAKPLAQLSRRHEIVAVRLFDPLEMNLPNFGMLVMQDSETGEQILVDTHDKKFRERFAQAAERREAELRMSLQNAGVDAMELATDDDLADAIFRFAEMRKRRSSLSAGSTAARRGHGLSMA